MTNRNDDFEREVRASFRRHLSELEPLVPDRPRPAVASAPRVHMTRVTALPGVGLVGAAILVLALVLALALGVAPVLRPGPVGVSPAPSETSAVSPNASLAPSPVTSATSPTEHLTTALKPEVVASFGSDELGVAVLGLDRAAYVIDSTDASVYRVNLATGEKLRLLWRGLAVAGATAGAPRMLAAAGPDVLILDDANVLWRWRPAAGDVSGRGSIMKVNVPDAASWGPGVGAIATYVVNTELGLYDLYVAVPSARQILRYLPATDFSGFPIAGRSSYLAAETDVSAVSDLYVDGKVYIVDGGAVTQWAQGLRTGWAADVPGGAVFTRLASDSAAQDEGNLYLADTGRGRIVVVRKSDGAFVAEYEMLGTDMTAVRGLFVIRGNANAANLYWTRGGVLERAAIQLPAVPTALATPMAPAAASMQ